MHGCAKLATTNVIIGISGKTEFKPPYSSSTDMQRHSAHMSAVKGEKMQTQTGRQRRGCVTRARKAQLFSLTFFSSCQYERPLNTIPHVRASNNGKEPYESMVY